MLVGSAFYSFLNFEFIDHLVINQKRHLRNTQYVNFNAICPKYKRETEGGCTFAVSASRLWNNVPLSTRKVDSVACFKQNMWSKIFRSAIFTSFSYLVI